MIETIIILFSGPFTLLLGVFTASLVIRALPNANTQGFRWSVFLCAAFGSYAAMALYTVFFDYYVIRNLQAIAEPATLGPRASSLSPFAAELAGSELRRAFWHKASVPAALFFAAICEGMSAIEAGRHDGESDSA